jgi:hypothetical protein
MRHAIRATANLTLVVAGLIAGLFLAELGCRLAGYTTPLVTHGHGMAPQFYYKADPINGHDINEKFSGGGFQLPDYIRVHGTPFTVSSNSLGCRDSPLEQGADYVLLIGDSFTWGYVPLEQTWGAILQQRIGVRAMNCGVGGYGPRQERRKLEGVVGRVGRPRLVVVGYYPGNNLTDDYLNPARTVIDGYMLMKVTLSDRERGDRRVISDEQLQTQLKSFLEPKPVGFIAGWKDLLLEHSALYTPLRESHALRRMASTFGLADPPRPVLDGLEPFLPVGSYPWLDKAWEEHLANLRELKSAADSFGANLLVIILPHGQQGYESLRPPVTHLDWEYPNKRLAKFFEEENIAFVDLLEEFRRYARRNGKSRVSHHEDLFWRNDGHPNIEGNSLAGLLISRHLLKHSLLELPDRDERLSDVEQLLSAPLDLASVIHAGVPGMPAGYK